MPVQVKRREDPRSRTPDFYDAEIEFTGPDGTAHKWPLVELSVNGGSFQLPERIPCLKVGTTVAGAVIRIGELEIHVNFVIRRVTSYDGKVYECGVQLYTMNDQDRNEMAALISRLDQYL
jgi:hypothetical protein